MNNTIKQCSLFFLLFCILPTFLLAQDCTVGNPNILHGATATLCGNTIEVEATIGANFIKPTFKWRAVTSAIGGVIFGSDDLKKTTITGISAGDILIYLEVTETDAGGTCGSVESERLALTIGNNIPTLSILREKTILCSGERLNLTGNEMNGATYEWSVTPEAINAFSTPNSATTAFIAPVVSRATIYEIAYKVSNGSCADSSKIFIRINPPLSATIKNGESIEACIQGEINLIGLISGGSKKYAHQWDKIGGTGTESIATLLGGKENTSNPVFTVPSTATIGTTYALRYTLSDDTDCPTATAEILITVADGIAPMAIDQTHTQCSDAESELLLEVTAESVPAAFWDLIAVDTAVGLSPRKWNVPVQSAGITSSGLMEDAYENLTASTLTANYTIAPISSIGCKGNPITVTVDVFPQPIPIEVAKDLSICSNASTDILLMTDPQGVSAANWEIWRVIIPEGIEAGNTNAVSGMISADAIRNDKFLNTTNQPLTVEYIVQPFSSEGCNGRTMSLTVDIKTEALPSNVNAGTDQANNCATITVLNASNNPTGKWEIIGGDDNGLILEPNEPNSGFMGFPGESYNLEWQVSSPACSGFARDQISINFASTASLANVELNVNDSPISTGLYQAGIKVNSTGIVEAGADVTFQALSEINLTEGFHAKAGSNFLAKIEGCMLMPSLNPEIIGLPVQPLTPMSEEISMDISPNPFSDQSFITINLPQEELISIGLFNQKGQLIKLLSNEQQLPAGRHSISLTKEQIPIGLFYVRMVTSQEQIVKKMILMN